MSHKLMALVSPRDQRTAALASTGTATTAGQPTVLLEGRSVSVGDYLTRFPATEFVATEHADTLSLELSKASERSCTLDFCMMLLDSDLSLSLKQRAAEELDVLLLSDVNRNYTLDILLSNPLPQDTDFESAKDSASTHGEAYRFMCLLKETRERAAFAFTAWLSVRENAMVAQHGQQRIRGTLMLSGAYRRVVTELKTQSHVRDNSGALLLDMKHHLDARILQAFLNEYRTQLPEGVPANCPRIGLHSGPIGNPEYKGTQQLTSSQLRVSHGNAEAEQERAVGEVETIAQLFVGGKDQLARKYRDELIARQSTGNDHSHLVKSLCNIASKCTTGGRHDVAAECLTIAVGYEHGVDSRLFLQMGNLFKDLKKYEEAAECFRKAKPLATTVPECDVINRELARLLVSRGEYTEALKAFRSLSDITTAPESRTSMATLLRKMGDLVAARHIFEDVWSKYNTYHSFAGLAELHRHTGRLDKAIKKYNWLLAEMDIDARSCKVFRVALSSLHRASGNLDGSMLILNALHTEYASDVSIQLEMAKVFRLLGDSQRADELYNASSARLHETDQLAAQLYETAIMTKEEPAAIVDACGKVLPELETLSHCNNVLRRIVEGNLGELRRIAPPPASPFKLHADFSSVLLYHSRVLLSHDIDPKGDIRVNRIRKRGLHDMKMAVRAIDQRSFDSALHFEQRACLSVA